MIEVDPKWFRLAPYEHQLRGVKTLVAKPRYGLFWQMRLGKSKAVIDAACCLRRAGELDAVVVACPAQVKQVWLHDQVGEIGRHCWEAYEKFEVDSGTSGYLDVLAQSGSLLKFLVVSHELLRSEDRGSDFPFAKAVALATRGLRVWVVYDEASAFGNHKSLQTKSALRLQELARPARVTTLDGTPVGNSPMEQYSKFKLIGPDMLGYKNFFHFRAVHQVKGSKTIEYKRKSAAAGHKVEKTVAEYTGFRNQEYIDRKVRPFCEYLEAKDCLDMPEKVHQEYVVRLSPKTWRAYCEMRDEMVAELDSGVMSAQHASVKVLRLAQLCAGLAGQVEVEDGPPLPYVRIGDEAIRWVEAWLEARFRERADFKCVIWARWRPEVEEIAECARRSKRFWTRVGLHYGRRKDYAEELHPETRHEGPYVLVAQPQSMRYGVNLSAADTELFASQDYNLITRQQAEERIQMPGSRRASLVGDLLVEGPNGERTVTWDILRAQREKEQVARRTAGAWKRILTG